MKSPSFGNALLTIESYLFFRALLRSADLQKDLVKYREVVQKVIMYMTLGVDVSPLFSEMIMVRDYRSHGIHLYIGERNR